MHKKFQKSHRGCCEIENILVENILIETVGSPQESGVFLACLDELFK